ncbi:helix-turn-helix domain-containing protein [Puteibacter caeruleilacunae]|nr:helix-turn-helix domain-containing protein [Puteibacter caeruleilacunae]
MDVISDIQEFITKLKLDQKTIHPYFHIFRLEDYDPETLRASTPFYQDFFEIAIAIEDNGRYIHGQNTYEALDKTISFLSPEQITLYERESGIAKGFCILFKGAFFEPLKHKYEIQNEYDFFRIHTSPIYQLSDDELSLFVELFNRIHAELERNDEESISIIRAYLLILLSNANRLLSSDKNSVKLSRFEEIASKFEDLVSKHTSKYNTIPDYAALLHISPTYLSECVRKATGKSAKQIITDYKLLKAKSLLSQSSSTIKEVAYTVGYDDTTNFTKFFKKHVGKTPKEFKRKPLV